MPECIEPVTRVVVYHVQRHPTQGFRPMIQVEDMRTKVRSSYPIGTWGNYASSKTTVDKMNAELNAPNEDPEPFCESTGPMA